MLKARSGNSDAWDMGLLLHFPVRSESSSPLDGRAALASGIEAEAMDCRAFPDPSDWGYPRAFFLVSRPTDDALSGSDEHPAFIS